MEPNLITNVHRNRWGEIVGECEGRPVKWTWSTRLWYWADASFAGYVFGAVVEQQEEEV